MTNWIKCSERLPEMETDVIVSKVNGHIRIGFLAYGHQWCVRPGSWPIEVTHWQPLPEAPKDEYPDDDEY